MNYATMTYEDYNARWAETNAIVNRAAKDGIRMPRLLPQFEPRQENPLRHHYRELIKREAHYHMGRD